MNNPIDEARQYLYQLLASSALLSTIATYNAALAPYSSTTLVNAFSVHPDWPKQGVSYPLIFLTQASPAGVRVVGTTRFDDNGLWWIQIVGDRDWNLIDLKPAVDEALRLFNRSQGLTTNGIVSGCSVTEIRDLPYQVGADEYPRRIVYCRIYAGGN